MAKDTNYNGQVITLAMRVKRRVMQKHYDHAQCTLPTLEKERAKHLIGSADPMVRLVETAGQVERTSSPGKRRCCRQASSSQRDGALQFSTLFTLCVMLAIVMCSCWSLPTYGLGVTGIVYINNGNGGQGGELGLCNVHDQQ